MVLAGWLSDAIAAERTNAACATGGRRGGFIRGQFRGKFFVFQFAPTKFFCSIWGTFYSLCILRGASASFSMESQTGPCSFFISDELVLFKILAYQNFTQLLVH